MMDEKIRETMIRIAGTPDGEVLYRYLQSVLCEVSSQRDDGALREDNGRRRFAHDLMTQMGEGIRGGRDADTVILGRRGGDDQPGRKLNRREWIASQPSWLDDPDPNAGAKPS